MTELLCALSAALGGGAGLALGGAFAWGLASVALSPCHLAGVPLVVAYTGRSTTLSGWRAASLSTALALGILVTVAAAGAASVAAARLLGPLGRYGNYALAALLFLVGLELLGVWAFPWALPRAETTRRGLAGAFGLGLAMGVLLGPCTLAFVAPVIGVVLRTGAETPALAFALMVAFALGHCGIIAAAGAVGPRLARHLAWSSRRADVLRRACGVIVVAGGLYLVYTAA